MCLVAGLLSGVVAILLTNYVYLAEDFFHGLKLHWMWWPALGGVVIGVGGYIYPRALGVGYDVIEQELRGDITTRMILGILLVKTSIWAISLGSGTSGGVLAPLLMTGGALGGMIDHFAPGHGPGFWPVIGMTAVLGGTIGAPLTSLIFAIELTHDVNLMLPLLIAVTAAHAITVLTMKRSILTEKVSRRGFHLSREYGVDPLEILFAREMMRTEVVALPASQRLADLEASSRLHGSKTGYRQGLYPVVDDQNELVGVVTRNDLLDSSEKIGPDTNATIEQIAIKDPIVAFPDESLRAVAERMAQAGITRLPVVQRHDPRQLVGLISLADLMRGRTRAVEEERKRERNLRVRLPAGIRTPIGWFGDEE
jgi:CBS domain-containing protein